MEGIRITDAANQLQPVHLGHLHVRDHDVRTMFSQMVQRLAAVTGTFHAVIGSGAPACPATEYDPSPNRRPREYVASNITRKMSLYIVCLGPAFCSELLYKDPRGKAILNKSAIPTTGHADAGP